MRWKDIPLGLKFTIGFGLVLILLAVVGGGAILGIQGIVSNADAMIESRRLESSLSNRVIEHLNWAGDVASLLTDDEVRELTVETDPTKCAFGQWYYSDARRQAERAIPGIGPLLADIEAPHNALHASAVEVGEAYQDADPLLVTQLEELKSDYLTWAHRIKDVFVDESITSIAQYTDAASLGLTAFLSSDVRSALASRTSDYEAAIARMEEYHARNLAAASDIERLLDENNRDQAAVVYNGTIREWTYDVLSGVDVLIQGERAALEGFERASEMYASQTSMHLADVQGILTDIISTARAGVISDDEMLAQANITRLAILIVGIIAVVVGTVLATVIAAGITKPLRRGMEFSEEIAGGNLHAVLELDQRDEVGKLGEYLRSMEDRLRAIVERVAGTTDNVRSGSEELSSAAQSLSSGTSEQAAAAEEISSSIEQMSSNISQNADNASETKQIAVSAAENAKESGTAVERTVEAMRNIAEKITIIEEIARNTNLLALNAAIEAARAGEQGKGFAVVAAEVRKLAENSARAAAEISELSTSSVDTAENAGHLLGRLVPEIQRTAELVQEISAASNEQRSGVEQINRAMVQLDQITQQNASTSEELASTSDNLRRHAFDLSDAMSFFDATANGERGRVRAELSEPENNKAPEGLPAPN
jgi:methyl-accepting chemotaxis protein